MRLVRYAILYFSDSYDPQEAKNFFEQNFSPIYYIFYDVFISVEADIKQKCEF